ncbi:MAG TPA: peptide deformylase [Gaiellaceae bacterium]|jgi:peptide deformylase|nr:peptide deformylase [Gaiellaceae bacterium]
MADDHDHNHDHEHDHETSEELQAEAEADARRRFALAQIRQYGDPALRLTAYEVSDFDDDLRRLVDRMTELMHDAQGVGLAATQVGVLRRVFVFEPDEAGPRIVVNPTIVTLGDELESDGEGCLSLQGVRVPVERPTTLTIAGKDQDGEDVSYELIGYEARIAQHELDHLDGVLIIDRTDEEHRKEALATLRPRVTLR